MDTQHSPGLWHPIIIEPGHEGFADGRLLVSAGGTKAIDCDRCGATFEESAANARLIAAAPALLAALDNLLRVTVDAMAADGIELTQQEQRARDAALYAIARATGSLN
jgi:hypothetical protein